MELKIAIYLRLSNEDGDKDESDSISSQRKMITNYVTTFLNEYDRIQEYVDDGYTGTNFNRPSFIKMIKDIESGEINCIIVKDLSRFGRDYIGVGEYLEKIFPLNDIRFIAINDGYDTERSNGNDDFIMPIKNIFNAQYSKDISKKVKSSFRSLQNDGKFVGAFTSYGYIKDKKDRHKLVIDEPAAQIVRRIFDLYASGIGKQSIAKILNEENIPCPSEYKKISGMNYSNTHKLSLTKYWTYSTIHNILNNEMYIGNMVQNKSIRKTVRGRAKKNNKDEWIIVENTHEPIIEINKWDVVQTLLKKNTRQLDFNSNVGLFAGYLICGDCGRAMSKITNKYKTKEVTTYICGSYKRYGANVCSRHSIKKDTLEELVLDKLNEEIAKMEKIELPKQKENNKKIDIKKYEIQLEKIYNLKKSLYEDLKNGIITQEEYVLYKKDYSKEEQMIQGQLSSLNSINNQVSQTNEWINRLIKYKKIKKLDREIIAKILDKIIITETNESINAEIIFKFALS